MHFLVGFAVGLAAGIGGSVFGLSNLEVVVIAEIGKLKADVLAAIALAKTNL